VSHSDDLAALVREQERRELEAKFDAAELAFFEAEARICHGCFRKWSVTEVAETRPRVAIWIPEAGAYWHLRCWELAKERGRGIGSAR
jgi:hypothetical protein